MSKQVQFKVSIIAATISMMVAGSAFATATGNVVVGPAVTSGAATVNIDQVGDGNVLSNGAALSTPTNGAFVVNSGTATLTLTVQQVGASGETPTGANLAGINAYTTAATKIRLFQGGDATGPGGTTSVGTGSTDIGTNFAVTGNKATITLGSSSVKSGASEILVSQQGNGNTAALTLGSTAFMGVMQVMQLGATNTADVTVSGQTTSKIFNIGQGGASNKLLLTAVNMGGDVTANFGGPSFDSAFTSSNPTALSATGGNNAADYTYITANGVTGSSAGGINLGSTAGFNLTAITGGSNNVQADLATADTNSKVNVTLGGTSNLALDVTSSAKLFLGSTSAVTVSFGKTLAMYDNGSAATQTVNGVTFNGNGYFSTSATTTATGITLTNGVVDAGGAKVLQSVEGSSFSAVGTAATHWVLDVNQGGTSAGTVAVTSDHGGLFNLTQTSGSGDSGHSMTLADQAATGGSWTVLQNGLGAKILGMTSSTDAAVINVSQTGALAQSATAINFAAASGSTFYLAQK